MAVAVHTVATRKRATGEYRILPCERLSMSAYRQLTLCAVTFARSSGQKSKARKSYDCRSWALVGHGPSGRSTKVLCVMVGVC